MNYHVIPTNQAAFIIPNIKIWVSSFDTDIDNQTPVDTYKQALIHPYSMLSQIVSGGFCNGFFEFVEIFHTLHIIQSTRTNTLIKVANYTEIPLPSIPAEHIFVNHGTPADFILFYGTLPTMREAIHQSLSRMHILLHQLKKHGHCIFPADFMDKEPMRQLVYLLSIMFEKVQIVKPLVSSTFSTSRYIICKNYQHDSSIALDSFLDHSIQLNASFAFDSLSFFLDVELEKYLRNASHMTSVESIIDNEIPRIVINRLEESELIVRQQQYDSLDQLFLFKEEKAEQMKKINLQKCIQWCEKYQISHVGKPNIFLPMPTEDKIESTIV